jgi:predicted nuclease with RNAse H fold
LTLHHFTRREVTRLLTEAGFEVVEVRPVSAGADGRLGIEEWLSAVRAYGYLVAARRPG